MSMCDVVVYLFIYLFLLVFSTFVMEFKLELQFCNPREKLPFAGSRYPSFL